MLLAAFVDKYVKSKLVKDIAPWTAHLPDEVRTEIAELMKLATVRRNVELTLKFSHVPTPTGFLRLETNIKFDVENMTNETVAYPHSYSAECAFPNVGEPSLTEFG